MEDRHARSRHPSTRSRQVTVRLAAVFRRHRFAVALFSVLCVAALARLAVFESVFRAGRVVLLSNDPYYYRFVVERHVAAVADGASLLPYADRDPLLVVGLSLLVVVLGADAGMVLAWYPVVVGLATVGLLAALTALATGSRLAGLVAAAVLALSPVHVTRTSLGFADHHAVDYLWLVLGATLLLAVLTTPSRRRRLLAAGGLALTLAVQVFSWEAGVVLTVPAAVVVVLAAVANVVNGRRSNAPLAAAGAFLVAAGLVAAGFTRYAWHDDRLVMAFAALAAFVAAVCVLSRLLLAFGASGRRLAGLSLLVAAVGGIATIRLPAVVSTLSAGGGYLESTADSGVAETVSLVGGPLGPLTGPLSLFGLGLFIALPALVVATLGLRRRVLAGPLLLVIFAWFFLALALVQRRFAGELSPFVAAFVGIVLVDLAWRADVLLADPLAAVRDAPRPLPPLVDRFLPAVLAALIVAAAVTTSGFLVVKLNQSVVTDAEYETARAIDEYATAHGLDYPDSYVLSPMGSNRLYNYEVSGETAPDLSYRFAQAAYPPFRDSSAPDRQYWQLRDRVGFVVTTDLPETFTVAPTSTQAVLHDRLGADGAGVAGTGHYRLVHASADGSVKAFALVPGAVVVGTATPGQSVVLSAPITVGARSFTYTRATTATDAGWYAVTVPYPATYTVDGRRVAVTEAAVRDGEFVDAAGRTASSTSAHWTFDAGRGDVVFDPTGGYHGRLVGPVWTDDGLQFRGTGDVSIRGTPTPTAETGLALTVRFTGVEEMGRTDPEQRRFPRLVATAPASRYTSTDGYQLGLVDGRIVGALGDGASAVDVRGPAVDDGAAHTVSLLWDGSVVRLVVDGVVVDEAPYTGTVTASDRLVVGATTDDRYHLRGVVTDLRLDLVPATDPPESHAHEYASA